jgi:pimeloyl-ACP methyl ester carboxylesterase
MKSTLQKALHCLLTLPTLFLSAAAFAQDYARELRWEQEVVAQLVVGDPVKIKASTGREFLGLFSKGNPTQPAIILLHGVGVHPDFGVTGQLRTRLNDLGYTTLSIQMPVQSKEAKLDDYYPTVFPNAKDRISQTIAWLQTKGYSKPVLLSHSMGSWMANEYLDEHHRKNELSAWVCMSLTGGYSWSTRNYKLPMFDVYGEFDIPVSVSSAWRRASALQPSPSRQLMIPAANTEFGGKEQFVATEIHGFINSLASVKQ